MKIVDRMTARIEPFFYQDHRGRIHICHGGELELVDVDLRTSLARGEVLVKATARARLSLKEEKA